MSQIFKWAFILFCFSSYSVFGDIGKEKFVIVAPSNLDPQQEQIYSQVISGIKQEVKGSDSLTISKDQTDLQALLDRINPTKVIALGKTASQLVLATTYSNKVVCGLYYFHEGECKGVTLAMDGLTIAKQIHALLPNVKRIFFVSEKNFQSIDFSRLGTNNSIAGLKLIPQVGYDVITTIRLVGKLVEEEAKPNQDIVFIPPNLPNDILFNIVEIAWDKKIPLMTTNLGYLENGAVIAFFPDETEVGKQIGVIAQQLKPGYQSSKKIKVALNRLISKHLDLNFPETSPDPFAFSIK